jgi:hypothetical protein
MPSVANINTARLSCVVPITLMEELRRREAKTGVYHTRIASLVLSNTLLGGIVRR